MDVYQAVPNDIFHGSLDEVKQDLHQIQHSGRQYVTYEIDKEFRAINNGISHIKLDDTFLRDCDRWRENFPMRRLATERANVVDTMGGTSVFLGDYKQRLSREQVQRMQDNQVRESHHWARENLRGVRSSFDPLANNSHDRITQFCDWIGVTDRYTGYRQNLNRGRGGLGKDRDLLPERVMGRWNLPKQACDTAIDGVTGSGNFQANSNRKGLLTAQLTKQELAGINLVYPGRSEYVDRYRKPPSDKEYHYTINPQPDFSRTGRRVAPVEFVKPKSEYGDRYLWNSRLPQRRSLSFVN